MTTELERQIAARLGRRDVLKIGGLTLSLAAIVAACGDDRTGSTDPGRIGIAPPITDPPNYPVDDAVLFRTGSSIEQTTIILYETILDLGVLDAEGTALIGQLLENHKELDRVMGELTVAAGGEVWPCTNPWFDDRYLVPITDAIKGSDNQTRDIYNVAVSFENLGAATYQQYSIQVTTPEQRLAVVKAAPYASRELDHVRVEMHGDVAITYGRYVARMKAGDPERQQFDLWFERVYAKRDGRWLYLSHRTVDGPHFSRVK